MSAFITLFSLLFGVFPSTWSHIEEFFSAWRWKVYDLRLQAEVPLIQAMEEACDQMEVPAMQGWIHHSRRFFPRCLANDNIDCDVDEILWPDPSSRRDNSFFVFIFTVTYNT